MNDNIVKRSNPLNKAAPPKYFAGPVWGKEQCSTDELAEEISLATSLSPADVRACIACFMQSIPRHLMKREAVNCDTFGIFRPSAKLKKQLETTKFLPRARASSRSD